MSEPISLLKEIRLGGYEASLITTFNAYLPFYEDVVLRHLMGSGVRHNVLMMDASQVTLAFERHPPFSAGRFYTLVPIKVSGAFHPKVILLVGKKKGTLLVGSHNMTLSGFGYNREMTNLIHYSGADDIKAAAHFKSAWQNVLSWAETQAEPLPAHIINMIKKIQDFATWLQGSVEMVTEECRVLSSRQDALSLWQQLVEFVGPGLVKQVIINGAFFDANLLFIKKVREELTPEELIVGIDPATVQFPVDRKLSGVSFVNCARLGLAEKDDKHVGYLHAKSILIQRGDGEMVLAVGSANPSSPAWLAPGITQNVEMMIARKGEDAHKAAEELGLTAIASMPSLTDDEWAVAKRNWDREDKSEKSDATAQVVIATAIDNAIRFRVPGGTLPAVLDCDLATTAIAPPITKQAHLTGGEYILSVDGSHAPPLFFHFKLNGKRFTGLVQCVKQIEGLSRSSSQRKFTEALASLTTGMPNLEHFIDCIKDIIKISDRVAMPKITPGMGVEKKTGEESKKQIEGAELSIGIDEVEKRNHQKKQRLRGSDDLGYLLDVLLYNLRDEHPIGLDVALEERDAKGRSEEEQVNADDDEEVSQHLPYVIKQKTSTAVDDKRSTASDRSPLAVCHHKVGSLVSMACKKLDALKQGKIELTQLVVIMAGILSVLRLLRGLDGKVPWIRTGQTAVPQKELQNIFHKITEVVYDGDKSIICLDSDHSQLTDVDELARLKGLIIWLAWESGIAFTPKKPLHESLEERTARYEINRHYVATAQLIACDEDVISEARQSIGQFSSLDMDWFEKILAVDRLFRDALSDQFMFPTGGEAKSGDFGFHSLRPEVGIREVLSRDNNNLVLLFHNSPRPRFIFPENSIRIISFERIFNA